MLPCCNASLRRDPGRMAQRHLWIVVTAIVSNRRKPFGGFAIRLEQLQNRCGRTQRRGPYRSRAPAYSIDDVHRSTCRAASSEYSLLNDLEWSDSLQRRSSSYKRCDSSLDRYFSAVRGLTLTKGPILRLKLCYAYWRCYLGFNSFAIHYHTTLGWE
jgi:hypothetical protein